MIATSDLRSMPVVWALVVLGACTPVVSETKVVATPTPVEEPATLEPVDLTPVEVADFQGGSSCNLILDDGVLFWALQSYAPPAQPTGLAAFSMATGAVLDCSRTAGTIMSVDASGDSPARVVARTDGWPWSLGEDADHLYWIGYCDAQLWTVAKTGGDPVAFDTEGLSVIDHIATPGHVLLADRFGSKRGIYSLDLNPRGKPRVELVAARSLAPWLMGALGSQVYWGERDGDRWTASSSRLGARSGEVQIGGFRGMPMDSVLFEDALFVLTTGAVIRLGVDAPIVEIATAVEYLDRGNLAVDGEHVYFANGKPGTISSVSHLDHTRREAHVGGEPCGVAVDGRYLYWLDRGRDKVMRAPLELFDAEPPSAEPIEPVAAPEPVELTGPPRGLRLDVGVTPIRVRGGWSVDVRLEAAADGTQTFDLAGVPTPNFSGETRHQNGETSGFMDGCGADFSEQATVLRPGQIRVFDRRLGDDSSTVAGRGETLTLQVELCQVGLPDGRWERVPAGQIVLEVTDANKPLVTITRAVVDTPPL